MVAIEKLSMILTNYQVRWCVHMCIINKVSRSNSDRRVITIEKKTKKAAILKLCVIFTKYLMCINKKQIYTDVLKIKFLAEVLWPGWLCTDDDDNDNNNINTRRTDRDCYRLILALSQMSQKLTNQHSMRRSGCHRRRCPPPGCCWDPQSPAASEMSPLQIHSPSTIHIPTQTPNGITMKQSIREV